MTRFLYCRDPLFLSSCALYALNRWLLKPQFHSGFLRGHFNDLLLIPCALPPALLIQRWLRLRPAHQLPAPAEIGFHLVLWCVLFEWLGPHLVTRATGDWLDVVAYGIGAGLAAWWWRPRSQPSPSPSTHEL